MRHPAPRPTRPRRLLGIGVLATTSDAATTWLAVQLASVRSDITFVEFNPLIASLVGSTGVATALGLRAPAGVVLVLLPRLGHATVPVRDVAAETGGVADVRGGRLEPGLLVAHL